VILVTRLNGKEYFINPHLIEFVEETPDTVITLTTGKKVVVEESAVQVVELVAGYRRQIATGLPRVLPFLDGDEGGV
jgi:flagellar protein FlbD